MAEFNNGWLLPSSGEWEVNSGHWEVGRISGKLCFCSLLQWQPRCSGLQKCGRAVGSEKWGVKGVEFRIRGRVGDWFRVRGSVGNRFRVLVSVRNRFREKYCPLLTTSSQLFASNFPLLGEKALLNQAQYMQGYSMYLTAENNKRKFSRKFSKKV